MAAITVSADYAVTPEQLWAALEPVERHVDWMADAESIEFLTAEHRGVGTRFVCVTKVGPIRLRDVLEITAWEPGRLMGVRHDGLVTGDGRFTLEPLDEGRRVRFTWTEDLTRPVVARRSGDGPLRRSPGDGEDLARQPQPPAATRRTSAVTTTPRRMTTTSGARRHAATAATATPAARASSTYS